MSMQPKVLLMCGVIAGPLFVTTLLIEGATKAGYSPLRHPGSSLAWGEFGWVQVLNFIVAGLLSLALALGLRRMLQPFNGSAWGPVLIACWAIGLIGAGIFLTDPVNGFPPGTPNAMLHPSWHGALHDLLSVPGFLCLDIACFVFSRWFAKRGRPGWALYSALTGIVFGIAFALASAAFSQVAVLIPVGGLLQRIAAVAGWSWLTLLAISFLRSPLNASRAGGALTNTQRAHR